MSFVRGFCVFVVFIALIVSGPYSFAQDAGLTSLITEALENNPDIKAARARLAAYQAKIPQAGSWDDPRVSVSFSNIPVDNPSLSRTAMTGIQYGIMQRLPFPGKKHAAKKKADLAYQAVLDEFNEIAARVVWQVRHHYHEHTAVAHSLSILGRNQQIADQLVRLAQARFATGLAPEQDVLKAQIEYGRITDQILELTRQRRSLKSRINSLIGRDPQARIPVPGKIRMGELPDRDQVLLEAQENFWMLSKRKKMIAMAAKEKTLARLSYFPDVDVGLSYRQRRLSRGDPVLGEDFVGVSLSIPIPVFAASKQSKKVKEANALFRESQEKLESLKNQITFEVEDMLAELKKVRSRTDLIANILLPQARAAFENSMTAYQTGVVDFLNVLTSQLSVLHFELELVRAHADYAKAEAKLAYLMGKPVAESPLVPVGEGQGEGEVRSK